MVTTQHVLNLFLIFVRVLAVLMTAPLFNNRSVPALVKIGLAALLSLVLLPLPGAPVTALLVLVPTDVIPFGLMIAQEVFTGVTIGFVSNMVFTAVGVAANMMGLQTGFRAANLFNPFTNVSSSALDQFYTLIAIALFLAIDGHHLLILALVKTFEITPPGAFIFDGISTGRLLLIFNQMFVAGVTLALPVVGTLLLTDLGLGLIARVVPQIQVFFVGLPLKVGLGFISLALTMAITLPIVREMFFDIEMDIVAILSR